MSQGGGGGPARRQRRHVHGPKIRPRPQIACFFLRIHDQILPILNLNFLRRGQAAVAQCRRGIVADKLTRAKRWRYNEHSTRTCVPPHKVKNSCSFHRHQKHFEKLSNKCALSAQRPRNQCGRGEGGLVPRPEAEGGLLTGPVGEGGSQLRRGGGTTTATTRA